MKPPPAHAAQNSAAAEPASAAQRAMIRARLQQAVRAAGGNTVVAQRSGVPVATVNNYMRARHGMKLEALAAMAAVCNISLEWLVTGEVPAAPAQATPPEGLSDAQADLAPAVAPPAIDVPTLVHAIQIVAAITDAPLHADAHAAAQRIATTYALLVRQAATGR